MTRLIDRLANGTVVVTGANGFIGKSVMLALERRGYSVIKANRLQEMNGIATGSAVGPDCDFSFPLTGIDAVVHLAGRAHIIRERSPDPLAEYRTANVHMTIRLARSAACRGVKRFVYMSSVGVHGRLSRTPFTEESPFNPHNDYALSKCEAETELHRVCEETGLEVVIIRPPLVYGPGVRANFLSLLKAVHHGIPLPFANVDNKRSLISLHNIADFVVRCLEAENVAGEAFLISDDDDISTKELVCKLARFMERPARLFPCLPKSVIRMIGQISMRSAAFDGVFGTLEVDISKARRLLGWAPPLSVDDGLRSVARWYLEQCGN